MVIVDVIYVLYRNIHFLIADEVWHVNEWPDDLENWWLGVK